MTDNSRLFNVAIVGATGAVGETLLEVLEERNFPVDNLYLLASERSAGTTKKFKNKTIRVENLATFDFSKAQIGLFSAGGDISAVYAPKAAEAGLVDICPFGGLPSAVISQTVNNRGGRRFWRFIGMCCWRT